MSEYTVEYGVPLPPIKRSTGPRKSKYPFATTQVGGYFRVDRTIKQMGSTVRTHEQATGWKFSVRSGPIEMDGKLIIPKGSVGIWRIK